MKLFYNKMVLKQHKEIYDKNKLRYYNIDLMEAIAMLLVIIYHTMIISYNFLENNSFIVYFNNFLRTILSTCVPIFFFCNGYLLFNKEFNLKKHIKKTVKIIVMTILWGLITIVALMVIHKQFLSIKEIIKILYTFDKGWTNHLWFMGTLVCIYFVYPILKTCFDSNKKCFIYFICICAILTFGNKFLNMLLLLKNDLGINYFSKFNFLSGIYGYAFVYFCIGGLMNYYKETLFKYLNIKKININLISVVCICISCIGLSAYTIFVSNKMGKLWDCVFNGYDTIFTFINVIGIYFLCNNYNPLKESIFTKFIKIISCNTMGIYLIHRIVYNLVWSVVKNIIYINNIFTQVIYSFCIMGICLLIVLCIKKIPIIKKLIK